MSEKEFRIDSAEELTDEKLVEIITAHKALNLRYEELLNLYIGNHAILNQAEKAAYKPDNRLVVNYAKYITDTFNGFFMGIPVKASHENEKVSGYIQMLESYNDIDDNNAELAKKCSIYGHAYELLFLDENAQVGIVNVDPRECFVIYDNAIRENALFGVRYTVDSEGGTIGTISDLERIRYFYIENGEISYIDEKEQVNYFGEIPIVEYVENDEKQGAFENVETLINAYNKAISEKANDVDYFADAYMKILGAELHGDDLLSIRDNRIINLVNPETDRLVVDFMEKPNADTTQENLINRLERQIFTISMVANINDENFGTSSGIALKYKLQSMMNLANTKERKFVKGFNKRFRLISNLPNSVITIEDTIGLQYQFTKNTPDNLKEEAETALLLRSIVSDETALRTLSIVDDVNRELGSIEEQNKLNDYARDDYNFESFDYGSDTH